MNLTVPAQEKGPALSCFAALSISLPLATDPSRSLHWAQRMCSGWQGV